MPRHFTRRVKQMLSLGREQSTTLMAHTMCLSIPTRPSARVITEASRVRVSGSGRGFAARLCRALLRTPLAGTGAYTLTTPNRGARVVVFVRPGHPKLVTSKTPAVTRTRGQAFRYSLGMPWSQHWHQARLKGRGVRNYPASPYPRPSARVVTDGSKIGRASCRERV